MRKNFKASKIVAGFSLIEMMIVVAIIGILAAIAYPSYVTYIEKGKRAECRSGLLKTMQQQERYFTQRNVYIDFGSGSTTAAVASFSGENRGNSACWIKADVCAAGVPFNTCIELTATPNNYSDSKVNSWFFDSAGQKQCVLNGTTAKVTNTADCWP